MVCKNLSAEFTDCNSCTALEVELPERGRLVAIFIVVFSTMVQHTEVLDKVKAIEAVFFGENLIPCYIYQR